jgi:hypothetical protein
LIDVGIGRVNYYYINHGLMGVPRSTISTWRLPDPILLLPISKDKLIATIAEAPGFYS